jgi:hypothetical protein
VKHLVLASFASALLGGMSGTSLMLWMTQRDAASEPVAAAASVGEAELGRRLELVERALAASEPRVRPLSTALASADSETTGTEPAALDEAPVHVESPVFEAAVRDIIDRTEDGRDDERAVARDEKRRQRDKYWVNELTMRLGLTPAQTERLITIQADLASELERERQSSANEPFTPRDKRRAAQRAIRQRADEQLRGALAPRQQNAYDQLNDELKLYKPKSND